MAPVERARERAPDHVRNAQSVQALGDRNREGDRIRQRVRRHSAVAIDTTHEIVAQPELRELEKEHAVGGFGVPRA